MPDQSANRISVIATSLTLCFVTKRFRAIRIVNTIKAPLLFWCVIGVYTNAANSDIAQPAPPYVIKFNNDGSVSDSSELKRISAQIARKPQTVVVFMHGWQGSASPNDHNLRSFTNALANVRARSYQQTGRTLTGVYFTWKARCLPDPFEMFAYYFTRSRADNIARGDGILTAINALSRASKHHGRERFLVAGHSFGARILGRVVGYHPEILREVDLYLLANTADGADAYERTLLAVSKQPKTSGRLPKLVWATSAHDSMTGVLYPLANGHRPPGFTYSIEDYSVSFVGPDAHNHYSAAIRGIARKPNRYAHNIVVAQGLGDHTDIWKEPMIDLVNFYLFH